MMIGQASTKSFPERLSTITVSTAFQKTDQHHALNYATLGQGAAWVYSSLQDTRD